MKINYIDINNYETIIVAIDDIYYNITEALEDVGYIYYNSFHCQNPKRLYHIYKNKTNYYIIKKVNYKNHFIMNIELANITELINRR